MTEQHDKTTCEELQGLQDPATVSIEWGESLVMHSRGAPHRYPTSSKLGGDLGEACPTAILFFCLVEMPGVKKPGAQRGIRIIVGVGGINARHASSPACCSLSFQVGTDLCNERKDDGDEPPNPTEDFGFVSSLSQHCF